VAERLDGRVAVIGVFASSAEDSVNNEAAPRDLQWLEALDAFLVCRIDAVPHIRLGVVQNHRIDAEYDVARLLVVQPPQQELLQQVPEQPDTDEGEPGQEPLDLMGGGHLAYRRLYGRGVGRIRAQLVEVGQVSARAVDEIADHLPEESRDRQAFPAFAHATEQPAEVRGKSDLVQVAREERQTTASRHAVGCRSDVSDSGLRGRAIMPCVPDIGHNPLGCAEDLLIRTFKVPIISALAQRVFCV